MDILKKLAELANKLDQRGLHSEASLVDEIIKEAISPIDSADHQYAKELAKSLEDNFSPYATGGKAFKKEVLDLYERGEGISKIMRLVNRFSGLMQTDSQLKEIMPAFIQKSQQVAQWRAQEKQQAPAAQPSSLPTTQEGWEEAMSGVAGKGEKSAPKKNPKVERFQIRYNQARKQLSQIMTRQQVRKTFPWIEPDGILGPRTRQARKLFPKLQQMVQQGKQHSGVPGRGEKQPPLPPAPPPLLSERERQLQQQSAPIQRKREQGGASFNAAQKQSGAIWKALVESGKTAGKSSADIIKRIEQYMGQGMNPEAAAYRVRREYGV